MRAYPSKRHGGIAYAVAPGYRPLQLDVWVQASPTPPALVVWIHGGDWMFTSSPGLSTADRHENRPPVLAAVIMWRKPVPGIASLAGDGSCGHGFHLRPA